MIQTSDAYKSMMDKPIRNRGYVSVSLGVVNQNAQGNASVDANTSRKYYSKGNLFDNAENNTTYGTLEQNFAKADGTFKFVPREAPNIVLQNNGIIVPVGESLTINFDTAYSIKGFTMDFVETSYPTDFTIVTDEETVSISDNDTHNFATESVLGHTTSITITPTAMSGGVQCMHIKRIVMGVGLTFSDSNVESVGLESFISGISIETSYKDLTVSAFDEKGQFDVDNESAFINYLQSGQPVNISFGVDLDDGTQEWHQVASCRLHDWSAKKGRVSFTATDLLSRTESTYSHMVLTSRTAKSEFEAIFADMGLTANDYVIDNYFASVNISNPIEENTHRDCLQLLANATRGIVYEDENGIIHVAKNFDRQIQATVKEASQYEYLTVKTDDYGNTSYVSAKSQYDGGFRGRNEQSVFNAEDTEHNSVTILETTTSSSYLPPSEVVNNVVVFTFDEEHSTANPSVNLTVLIRCKHDNPEFLIKEAGWYYLGYWSFDSIHKYFNKDESFVKWGNKDIAIERVNDADFRAFNFYVSSGDINEGDFFITATLKVTPTAQSNKVRFSVARGKDEYRATDSYEAYFNTLPHNPCLKFNASQGKFLLKFKAPHPLTAKLSYYNHGTITEDLNIDSEDFLVDIPDGFNFQLAFPQAQPYQAVEIEHVIQTIGNDYFLPLAQTKEYPHALIDEKIKDIKVKIFTYQDNGGEIEQVDDDVYYTETIDSSGITKTLENPLISTSAQAELVAKWLKAYYTKNVTYDIDYRGEPAMQANDRIYLENEYTVINPIDVQKAKITFNGAFGGQIEARKALVVES